MAGLTDSITALAGVGSRRAEQYAHLGVFTVSELLRLYPRTYEDWSVQVAVSEAPAGAPCCVRAQIVGEVQKRPMQKGGTMYSCAASDGRGLFTVTLFNAGYTAARLRTGETFLFYGAVTRTRGGFQMFAPQVRTPDAGGYIRPIYPQTAGLGTHVIERHMKAALSLFDKAPLTELLPEEERERLGLCTARFALYNIHFPESGEALGKARERLIFDELFLFELGLLGRRAQLRAADGERLTADASAEFEKKLPFALTGAQKRAVADGVRDMQSGKPMSRLIQGDVGSGKTAVAASLLLSAVQSGWQCAFMVPTALLARQHAQTLRHMLGDSARVVLLIGGLPAAERRAALTAIADGSADIVVGTHALLTDAVRFLNLQLVITDEQHRFGVQQRTILAEKGVRPHLLIMSATPIPRTLAMFLFGDMDVSVLNELPAGRQPVKTFAVGTALRERIYAYIRKKVAAGQQVYVVCPLVEKSEDGDAEDAVSYYQKLKNGALRDIPVALLHGQMPAKEKEATMAAFAAGKVKVLVSTVVIEVGVDVPNATLMVIEDADRFGLSQLHQLRGRVGRGKDASDCVLISDAVGEEAKRRLATMCATTDGFKIAEADFKMRGPGDFFGDRQHGALPQMRIAKLSRDMETLKAARAAAERVLGNDPHLQHAENAALRAAVETLFENGGDTLSD